MKMFSGSRGEIARREAHSGGAATVFPAAVSCGVLGLLVFAVGRMENWMVRLPGCLLKNVSGIPCPGCGGTRALQALSEGEMVEAFWFNPLIVIAAGLLLGWLALALAVLVAPAGMREGATRRFAGAKGKFGIGLGIVAAVQWGYLILFLK